MNMESIIEGLNRHVEAKRKEENIVTKGHLVLQKTITPDMVFKAYKTYKYILWFIKGHNRYAILEVENTSRVLDGQEENMTNKLDIELSHHIFNWIGSSFYRQVITGEYKGYASGNKDE